MSNQENIKPHLSDAVLSIITMKKLNHPILSMHWFIKISSEES